LARARTRFQTWRGQRPRGSRIPQRLWAMAVRLGKRHGVARTASALRLDYYGLKRRAASAPCQPEAESAAFIGVTSEQGLPVPSGDPIMLGVGPGVAQPFGFARFPARIEVSRQTQTIRLSLGRFDIASCPAPYPVIVLLPTPSPPATVRRSNSVRLGRLPPHCDRFARTAT
jgi:hypothetical protein